MRPTPMLLELSRWDIFRDVWGIPRYTKDEDEVPPKSLLQNALYKTMADCELVLRFFAIKETIVQNLGGSLKTLMDRSMKRHQKDDVETVSALKKEYKEILGFLHRVFAGHPFVLPRTRRPSRPAYDALMVGAALIGVGNLSGRESVISQNFNSAATVPAKYEVLVGRGNTVETIKGRIELAKDILIA